MKRRICRWVIGMALAMGLSHSFDTHALIGKSISFNYSGPSNYWAMEGLQPFSLQPSSDFVKTPAGLYRGVVYQQSGNLVTKQGSLTFVLQKNKRFSAKLMISSKVYYFTGVMPDDYHLTGTISTADGDIGLDITVFRDGKKIRFTGSITRGDSSASVSGARA